MAILIVPAVKNTMQKPEPVSAASAPIPPIRADKIGYYYPANGIFYLNGFAQVPFGPSGNWTTQSFTGDWDGDGISTAGVYIAGGTFQLTNSPNGGSPQMQFGYGPGSNTIRAFAGDWNGDGKDSIGVYDTSNGMFYLRNSNSSGYSDYSYPWGSLDSNAYPLAGDWDGDGIDSIGLYHYNSGLFQISQGKAANPGQAWEFPFGDAAGGVCYGFGHDQNGDAIDGVGVYCNPSIGTKGFHMSNTKLFESRPMYAEIFEPFYGPAGTFPVVGDWNGYNVP